MFQALYDLKSERCDCLSFRQGDRFTILDETQKNNGGWVLAQNGFGQLGLIPKNYIKIHNSGQEEVLKSIDRAIECIHLAATSTDGVYSQAQRLNLQRLVHHRSNVVGKMKEAQVQASESLPVGAPGNQNKRAAPSVPRHNDNSMAVPKRSAPPPPPRHSSLTHEDHGDTVAVSQTNHIRPQQDHNLTMTQHRGTTEIETVGRPGRLPRDVGVPVWSDDEEEVRDGMCGDTPPHTPTYIPPKDTPLCTPPLSPSSPQSQQSPLSFLDKKMDGEVGAVREESIHIASNFSSELVDSVRRTTGLSYNKSVQAVCVVLSTVADHVPSVAGVLIQVMASVQHVSTNDRQNAEGDESSHDTQRLRVIISELSMCKDDAQQRSWALHEDEGVILEYLDEFVSILENAKKSVCCRVIASEGYQCLQNLVQYYQMESRVSIRRVMLRMFGALCSLDAIVISSLMSSILPLELVRELQDNLHDSDRSSYIALVLSMLFTQGEDPPTGHYERITHVFLTKILDVIESSSDDSPLPDLLIQFFLAFNLHFKSMEVSLTMKALGGALAVKVFTERILLLFNREEDPVCMFDHKPSPPNSVLKLLTDMYSNQTTASILYSNDEKMHSEYLQLLHHIINNSTYTTHTHRLPELNTCLMSILHQDDTSPRDSGVIRALSRDYPQLFPGLSESRV